MSSPGGNYLNNDSRIEQEAQNKDAYRDMLIMSLQIARQFHLELTKNVKENVKLKKKLDLIKLEQEQA